MNTPSREILWNVNSLSTVIVMYSIFALSMLIGLVGIWRRVELWKTGRAAPRFLGNYLTRAGDLIAWALFQKGVVRERGPALFHTLIYFGFLVLLFTTTMVFIHHDLGIRIYQGDFYLLVTIFSDLFGLGLLIGVGVAYHRRYMLKPDRTHRAPSESIILIFLALLVVQGFLLEGLRIHVTKDPWASYSPIGLMTAKAFWAFSPASASLLHAIIWWFHAITVFAFVAAIPYTKFFHVMASSANLFFRRSGRTRATLSSPGDIEKILESGQEVTFGLGTIKDYSWKELLDLDACTSCGRCQDACPAYNSGKPLSPKWVILDSRNHMLALHGGGKLNQNSVVPEPLATFDRMLVNGYLESSGLIPNGEGFSGAGAFRAANPRTQEAVLSLGGNPEARIASEVIDPEVFWTCTTCMACVEACPVGIHHVDQIVGNRRNMVLMHGEIPSEAQATLRKLENQGNPYGDPADRDKWHAGLDVPILKPGSSVEYLYWVGCVSAYDLRKQKIARALVQIMNKAGLSYGILGKEECCTGDPARRLGEENLFQTLAKKNIATLQNISFKTIVTNCPHCFNTLKNEYPEFGALQNAAKPRVIHHSVLIQELIASGKITPSKETASGDSYTFHDPCYLGRGNNEYEAPRENLRSVPSLKILEMPRSREKGLCCGAGGGQYWMDLKIGDRVNVQRTEQAAATGASKIATACPFCMQMLEDGVKLTNREETMQVKDIAEVVWESI